MIAAEKKATAEALAKRLRDMAEQRAASLSQTSFGDVRDGHADTLAELAELIASLDFRQIS